MRLEALSNGKLALKRLGLNIWERTPGVSELGVVGLHP
jgi:hypothetical protein